MILWLILSVIACVIVFFCIKNYLKEEVTYGYYHFGWIIPCVLIVTLLISLIISVCAPRQYKPNEEIMFSHINCDSIVITPAFYSKDSIETDKININYKLQNNTATLDEEIDVYCCSFETSPTGYPYIEKYFCERISPIREFLYGSFFRPRWYYKIYLVPTE